MGTTIGVDKEDTGSLDSSFHKPIYPLLIIHPPFPTKKKGTPKYSVNS